MYELDYLHREIGKICPIDGLSQHGEEIIIHFKKEATNEQISRASDYLLNFKWSDDLEKIECDNSKINMYKDDLSIKSGFDVYKQKNPDATFLSYINYLEQMQVC